MTLFFVVLIGLCVGSFGNVLIERLPAGASIRGRSRCDGCNRALSPVELIPLISWIVLRGRCRSCRARIPARVPLVEALSGVLAAIAFMRAGGDVLAAVPFFIGLWALLVLAVIDLRTRTIPDVLTAIVFVAGIAFHWFQTEQIPVAAPLIGAGFFAVQWLASFGRWVGSGDILLAGAIGMLLGSIDGTIWTLLLAYAVGANVAIFLLVRRRLARHDMIPFGPFLVFAAFVVLLFGDALPRIPLL